MVQYESNSILFIFLAEDKIPSINPAARPSCNPAARPLASPSCRAPSITLRASRYCFDALVVFHAFFFALCVEVGNLRQALLIDYTSIISKTDQSTFTGQ